MLQGGGSASRCCGGGGGWPTLSVAIFPALERTSRVLFIRLPDLHHTDLKVLLSKISNAI